MSNLGGNSTSEDTDRSNNLKGDTGDTGATGATGAQGTQGDTGATGATGAAGVVQSVVAGTNITSIDNTDPANPIINAATQGGASPLTTKGDVFTYDTGDQRLAVGSNEQVLTADSAEATGIKWATPSAGVSRVAVLATAAEGLVESFSSSANAAKGGIYDCNTTVVIDHFIVTTEGDASATYKLMIAEVSGATNVIDVILHDSATTVANATDNKQLFDLGSGGVTLTSGKTIAIFLVRLDGTGTSACNVTLTASFLEISKYLSPVNYVNLADNNPIVTTALGNPTGFALISHIAFRL